MALASRNDVGSTVTPYFDDEWPSPGRSRNPLGFDGYAPPGPDTESVRTGLVRAPRGDYVLIECDFRRQGGTMGVVAGEMVVQAYARATELRLPVAQIVSSGGARLQEGFFALMQMGRTASAVAAHRNAGLRSAVAFRSPSTGGVFASWANSTDVRAGDPGAVIGFGGPRVVESVTGIYPPKTSHTAEAAFRDANIDALVPAEQHQRWLEQALGLREGPALVASLTGPADAEPGRDEWGALQTVRDPRHPSGMDWAAWLVDEWVELRGQGPRFRAGIARIGERDVVVIAMDRNRAGGPLSLPTPRDFRLARRAIALADRTGMPLLTLIDTPGADPSPDSEYEGLAREIAHTLLDMASLRSPTVALCVGEGGSGGAMALAHSDTLYMLEGTVFAVIGPEAGSAVLYRDATRAPQLASLMRISAVDLASCGVVDGVLPRRIETVRQAILGALEPERMRDRDRRPDLATYAAIER